MKAIVRILYKTGRIMLPPNERKYLIITFGLIIGTIINASAANDTWTNGGGTGLWSTASNWSTGAPPTSAQTAVFESTYNYSCTINTQVSITGITISAGYTGTITQGSGDSIELSGNYSQSAGTFTGSAATINILGNWTLAAGTFTSTGGTLYINGNVAITAGAVYNANGGTFDLDLAGTTTVTVPTNGSIQFNNVVFNSTVGTIITAGDTMVVAGQLSLLENQVKTGVIRLIPGSSIVTNSAFTGGNAILDIQAPLTITPLCAAFCGVDVDNSSAVFNAPAFTFTMNGALNVYSGTFNGGTDSIWVNGAFKQTGGTFNASSGTMIFGSSYGYSAGTFNNNSGTVEFNNAANSTFTNTGLITFYNAILNTTVTTTKLTLTATDTLKTSGTLTLNEGTLNGGYMIPGSGLSIGSSYAGGTTVMLLINPYTYTIPSGMNIPPTTVNGASTIVSFASGSSPVFIGAVKLLNGTFNCNSTQWAMSQALTISGGTFNATTDTIKYSNAALTISTGATYNHNNGTFDFMNSTASTAVTNTLKTLMYNVIINLTNATKASAELTVAAADTLVVVNSLTLAAGYFNSGLLQLEGTVNDLGSFGGGAGVIYIANGSGSRNINFASAQLPGVSINDVNASVNAPSDNDVTFNGVFTLTNGQFFPSGYAVTTLVAYSQSGGTFWQNTDSVTHTTTFTLSGGAYYPTSGVTIVTGAYSQTGGTFESGGGLTYFKGAFTLNVGSFYPPSAVMTVTGAFTLTTGTFYSGTYNEIFNGTFAINGGTFTATSDTTYIGSTTLNIATAALFSNNSGTFTVYNSTGNCTVTNATKELFYNFVINLTNATQTSAELKVTTNDTIEVTNTLTLEAGNINTGLIEVTGGINDPGTFSGGTGLLYFANGAVGRTITFTSAAIPGLKLNDANVTVKATSTQAATIDGAVTVTTGVLSAGTYPATFNSTYTQTGGTFGTASVNEYFVGVFDVTGGAFNASSDTTIFETTTTFGAGAIFSNNSGTINCTNSSANFTLTVPISFNVYNFYVNFPGATNNVLTISTGDTVIVNNSLALVDGEINTGLVELKGNSIQNATAFNGGSATVIIANGSGTRSITLPAATWPTLVLNDVNATLNGPTSGTCSFQGSVTVKAGTLAGGAGIISIAGSYSQTGGTFTGGAGSLDVSTNFAISGTGTVFTAPADTLNVTGTFTITSPATFNHNNGTLYLAGATNKTLTAPSALTLGSLVVGLTSATLSPNQALTITGNLTIGSSAILSQTTSSINIALGGSFNDLNASGGLVYGTKTFTFNGSSAQTISGANGLEQFYNLVMSNTSGGVTLTGTDVYVNKLLTLTPSSGVKVILDTNNLIIDSTASISGGTSTEFIITGGGGYLMQQGLGPGARSGSVVFPVGNDASDYTPVTMQNTGTDDEYEVSVQTSVLTDGTTGSVITGYALNQTYFLREATEGGSNVTLTLQWNANEELPGFDRTNCIIRHYHDNYWNDEGSYGPASGSGPYYKTVSGVTSFCPWGGGSGGGGGLPITLVNFSGMLNGSEVDLGWETQIEINNNYFTIERSSDGVNFTELGTVEGAGNSTVSHDYTLVDEHPLEGTNYYILKQTDFDGNTVQVGSMVAINYGANNSSNTIVSLYPNPLEGTDLKVSMTGGELSTDNAIIIITDLSGRNVYSGTFVPSQETSINLPSNLAAGMYLVKINSGGKDYNQKLMIR